MMMMMMVSVCLVHVDWIHVAVQVDTAKPPRVELRTKRLMMMMMMVSVCLVHVDWIHVAVHGRSRESRRHCLMSPQCRRRCHSADSGLLRALGTV